MPGYKIVGGIGAIILAASVLMPSRIAGVTSYIAYVTAQPTNALLVLAIAVMAVLLIYANRGGQLFLLAMAAMCVVVWAFLRNKTGLGGVEDGLSAFTMQLTSTPLMRTVSSAVDFVGVWWVMFAGAALLVAAALMAPRQQ